ncbi:MAG: 1-deoxy-D-xylulose-5-phosphate reductoisomerase [Deltaproteobacteria bacterium]|jgi:1-deoxy-D-xylulose-5-phosphate reductoisomerase|nr:1-deoxy-D-xylulose-5-phosphate reductoisomerase [Deltaproteobacteria bacterium]
MALRDRTGRPRPRPKTREGAGRDSVATVKWPVPLSILGATGSIGDSAASLARTYPERVTVVAMAGGRNVEKMKELVEEFKPAAVSVHGEAERTRLLELLRESGKGSCPEIFIGPDGLETVAAAGPEDTVVLSAVSGAAGLRPTWAALKAGRRVALANKESMVLAGDFIMPHMKRLVVPVDSEHSALFQALGGTLDAAGARRLIITCSGGPFFGRTREELERVTSAEALAHPSWNMGPKITVDSATLMNKGLEVIEAHHLFQMPWDSIKVIVHPQSVIHSMVEHDDGQVTAVMGPADMRAPISYALGFPERWPLLGDGGARLPGYSPVSFDRDLTFAEPDRRSFPCLRLAEEAGRSGGGAPAVLNAASELAVEAFLRGEIGFMGIPKLVGECLHKLGAAKLHRMEDALEEDLKARALAMKLIKDMRGRA